MLEITEHDLLAFGKYVPGPSRKWIPRPHYRSEISSAFALQVKIESRNMAAPNEGGTKNETVLGHWTLGDEKGSTVLAVSQPDCPLAAEVARPCGGEGMRRPPPR